MSTERTTSPSVSRREFLRLGFSTAILLFFNPKLETQDPPEGALLVEPTRPVIYVITPLKGRLSDIVGNGYSHLDRTYDSKGKTGRLHIGTDFNVGTGDEDLGLDIRLIMNGVCIFIGHDDSRSLGNIALFRHRLAPGVDVVSRFAHCLEINSNLEVGTDYRPGKIVGKVGKSGWIRGLSHLHLDICTTDILLDHYSGPEADPWWFPHENASATYINKHYLDPAELISKSPKPPPRRSEYCKHTPPVS